MAWERKHKTPFKQRTRSLSFKNGTTYHEKHTIINVSKLNGNFDYSLQKVVKLQEKERFFYHLFRFVSLIKFSSCHFLHEFRIENLFSHPVLT